MNLDKKIEQFSLDKNPQMLDLSKKAASIADKYGLGNKPARVAIVPDISGSMENPNKFYSSGKVQQLLNRAAALAVNFDDDGKLDIFPFHNDGFFFGSLSPLEVADNAAAKIIQKYNYGGTSYGDAFQVLHDYYWPNAGDALSPVTDNQPPVFVIFVTDGATENKARATKLIKQLSFRPCFVQAIALGQDYDSNKVAAAPVKKSFFGFGGGSSEPELEGHLKFLATLDDEVPGRYVDNFDFFGTKTPDSLSDVDFFDRMMGEYPKWLTDPKVFTMLGQTSAQSAWG